MTVTIDKCNDPECVFDYTQADYDCIGKTSKCEKCGRRLKWEQRTGFDSDGDEHDYIWGITLDLPEARSRPHADRSAEGDSPGAVQHPYGCLTSARYGLPSPENPNKDEQ